MSLLNEQIKKLVKDKLVYDDSDLSINAELKFDKNFIGFHGHFPDNPVLPGVVMIRVMVTMYEMYKNKEYILSEIKKVKFIEPVFAGDITLFSVKSSLKSDEQRDGIQLKGKVIKSGKNIAIISADIGKFL